MCRCRTLQPTKQVITQDGGWRGALCIMIGQLDLRGTWNLRVKSVQDEAI